MTYLSRIAKESIFTSGALSYNDFRGHWKEYFCSLVNYFNFSKKKAAACHPWREIQDYNLAYSNSKYTAVSWCYTMLQAVTRSFIGLHCVTECYTVFHGATHWYGLYGLM